MPADAAPTAPGDGLGRNTIAMIGERERVRGFGFAGVDLVPADGADEARAAWRTLPADVRLVILTAAAHAAVEPELTARDERLWVVVPE